MTAYLSTEDLLELIDDLKVGPIADLGLLDSAAHRPGTYLWGKEVYSSLDDKAAALFESLVRNHSLTDGNKRLGWLSVVVFYAINDVDLEVDDDEAYDFVISVASGQRTLQEIATQFATWHSQSTSSSK